MDTYIIHRLFITLLISTVIHCGTIAGTKKNEPHVHDNCTTIMQHCECDNIKRSGFCLTGAWSHFPGDLYCDCSSDILSPEELFIAILNTYSKNKKVAKTLDQQFPEVKTALQKLGKLFALEVLRSSTIKEQAPFLKNGRFDETKASKPLRKALNELYQLSKKYAFIPLFYTSHDGCTYPNQPATCGNTAAQGICAVSVVFRTGDIFAHCG